MHHGESDQIPLPILQEDETHLRGTSRSSRQQQWRLIKKLTPSCSIIMGCMHVYDALMSKKQIEQNQENQMLKSDD